MPDFRLLLRSLPPLLLTLLAAAACYLACGPTLGLFFGSLAFLTLLAPPVFAYRLPPFASGLQPPTSTLPLPHFFPLSSPHQPQAPGHCFHLSPFLPLLAGVSIIWFLAVVCGDTSLGQWFLATALLAAYLLALFGVVRILTSLSLNPIPAAALTTTLALAWLTWPIWLASFSFHDMYGIFSSALIHAHPLLGLNGTLNHLGYWVKQDHIYRITVLNQDVSYAQPHGAAFAILAHAAAGACLLLLAWLRQRRQSCPTG